MSDQLVGFDASAHWRAIVEQLPVTITAINCDRTIAFTNRAIDNRPPATLIGASAITIHTETGGQALLQQAMDHVLRTGETFSYECEETHANGSAWYLHWLSATKQDGQVIGLILSIIDITAQKQTAAALAQAQKLEGLSVLVGGVAHNFNNLLAVMLIQLASGAAKLPTEHPVNQHILHTMTAAERAAELTRQLLNYAGRSPMEATLLDLNDLITDNLPFFTAAIPKSVVFQSQLTSSIPRMLGDKGQLKQLLMNLILNSTEALGKQPGVISVETDLQDVSGDETQTWQVATAPLTAGRYVRLTIHDSGCGMDAQTLTKIFDPFFTTKISSRGLGLASVLGIVRMHKGGIRVASTLGSGTTFTLLFPALTDKSGSATPAPALPPLTTATTAAPLVLVIEDEDMLRASIVDILINAGLQVLQAADGPAGIKEFRAHVDKVNLVLLDLSMPGMNGEEVFRVFQTIAPQIPVVLLSGYSEQDIMGRFANKGLAGFIQKPFTIETLLKQIEPFLQVTAR